MGGFNKREKSGNLCEFRYWNHFNKGCSSWICQRAIKYYWVHNEKSEGLSRGVIVVDIDETVESIRKAVQTKQNKNQTFRGKDVIVGIPSNQISIEPCHGMIAVSSENREITDVNVHTMWFQQQKFVQ